MNFSENNSSTFEFPETGFSEDEDFEDEDFEFENRDSFFPEAERFADSTPRVPKVKKITDLTLCIDLTKIMIFFYNLNFIYASPYFIFFHGKVDFCSEVSCFNRHEKPSGREKRTG
jgi:hypothetical protein